MVTKIKDNPNPTANIGFVCYYPFHYYVYKNIQKHLPQSEFIIDTNTLLPNSPYPEKQNGLFLEFFSKLGVPWRHYQSNSDLTGKEFFSKYALLVGTQYKRPIKEIFNKDKKLVRVLYGHAKDTWNFGPWSAYFDLVLSYGHYSQKHLDVYGNSVVVGNPKFDDWFDANRTKTAKGTRVPYKPSLLYLPTWGELSSLPITTAALVSLANDFSIHVKAHNMTFFHEPELLTDLIQHPEITVYDDRDNILDLLEKTDVVLSDNSGAIFDTILADKPMVLIDFLTTSFIPSKEGQVFYRSTEGRIRGVATSSDSYEQRLKDPKFAVGPILSHKGIQSGMIIPPSILASILIDALNKDQQYQARRQEIRAETFAFNDGKCGERAAQEILSLLYKPKPKKNFLAQSIDAYLHDFFSFSPNRQQPSLEKDNQDNANLAARYREIMGLPYRARLKRVVQEFFS